MIIYFDQKTYQFLKTYVLKPGNIELEVRFGKYENGKYKPDIGLETFNKIKEFLSTNPNITNKVEEESKSEILPHHIRRITYSNSEKNIQQLRGVVKYEQKNKIYNDDIQYKDFVLRIAESEERPVQPYPVKAIEVRERERTMYFHNSGAFYFVLTKVRSLSEEEGKEGKEEKEKDKITYELEIEYMLRPELLQYFPDIFKDSISLLLSVLINNTDKFRYGYVPLDEENRLRDLYKSFYIKEPKPVNLSRQITPKLFSLGYTVTNKLDGERFILVFTDSGLYAFNNRKIEKYDEKNYGRITVMDSEAFNGVYYIFDCMIYNGENVTDQSHEERLDMASQLLDDIVSYDIRASEFLKMKRFYRTSLYEDSKLALKDSTKYLLERICPDENVSEIYKKLNLVTMCSENNDGLVYTSSGKYNSPVYKWKIPEKMSIDFAVYRIKKSKEIPWRYELYVKDNIDGEAVNVPFRGNSTYELEQAIYDSDVELKDGGIYEFGYDNSENKFVLFRPRLDKIDPNFITVAENVWSDIKNPYTKEELLELLSPIVLEEYREYQNGIKRGLIEKYCKEKTVLDLGSGRGGDLGKYDSAKVSYLWCIEPNPKNYTELLRRLSERKEMKRKTTLIKTVAQDTKTIVSGIKDTISYSYPIVFNSVVTYKSHRENISYTSLDNLRSKVSWGFDIDRNSFIVLDYNDNVITEDELYSKNPTDNLLKELRVFETSDENDIKKQELGGDFRNWFPKKYGVDYSKLKITDEGMYSLTKHSDSLAIIKAMKNIIGEENLGGLTILDGTANVGGDTIRFGMNFKKVISVELNKENYEVLKNNVEVFGFMSEDKPSKNKVETINGDITKVWNDVQPFTDVLFLDPPWGGKDYIGNDEEVLNLFLSGISISEFVGKVLMSPCRPSYIFIKLPVNYDINSFRYMPYISDMQIFTIRKFYLVCLTVDDTQMPTKKADILSSFFSLSFFFFKNELGEYRDLNNLVNTIDQTLKNDGYFIGTTIDGNKTRELLNASPEKKFDFNGGYIRFIDNIDDIDDKSEIVELLIRDTIVETQTESLVDFELLEAKLLERDIVLHDSEIFKPGPLSEKENTLNSLYRYFVFKRKSKEDIYSDKVKTLIEEKTRPIIQSVKNGKRELTSEEILKTLTLTDMKDETKCRDDSFFQLLDLKKNLVGDYKLLSFNYTIDKDENKSPDYLVTKYYEDEERINYLKEYYNSRLNHQNIFQICALIDNSPLYHVKSKSIAPLKEIFKYDQNVITSCIYQLYFIMMYLKNHNLQFSAPQIVLAKDDSVTSIKYGDEGYEIPVFNGVFVKLLNSSYTIDTVDTIDTIDTVDTVKITPPLIYDYNGFEILHYLDKHYKIEVLNNLDSCNIPEYSNFLLRFLTIETCYNNIEDDEINIIDSNPYNSHAHNAHNSDNNFSLSTDLYIKQALDIREKQINDLSDSQYEYYEKFSKIFKKIDLERSRNKVSNKITKWMEVITRYMLYVDREKRYKVLSTGYMPQMFLYALRSVTDLDFDWYCISDDRNSKTNIDFSKCKNWLKMDTTSPKVINYIDKKMNEKIDIYASYMNKDLSLTQEEENEKFLADILTGLVSLRQDGILMVNIKSFFSAFEIGLLGYISDMFKEFYIYKPISSDMLLSEVFIVGREYIRNEEKIKYLKSNRTNIPLNSLNISKYSNILLAAYKFYGRQMYFMDKDMECYRYLSEKYSIDELNEDLLRKNSNKMVRYYLKMRKNIQQKINKTTDSFNFDVKKWDNYGCISELNPKIKKRSKKISDEDVEPSHISDKDKKIHNGDWSKDIGTPITDISDELYDEKKEVYKSPVYTATKRCIGKDIFLNIVKMAYEVNKFDSIKNIIRRKLNFNKIPVLIRSLPQIPKLMPVGVELIPRKEIGEDPFVYIFIYKPKEGLYKLGVYIKFSDRSLNLNMYRRYAFKYDAEPKPETLVDWIVNIILNLIIDVYINNKKLKDFFTNMKDKKDKKDQKLDVLLDWFFDPAYDILLYNN